MRVLQALYAHAQGGGGAEHVAWAVLEPMLEKDPDVLSFARELFEQTVESAVETDALIRRHSENWDLDRIALTDRLVLRMALTEFLHLEDVPPKVSIDEAIEVAKGFSSEGSPSFVNGVLDAALSELKREGRLHKTGRGRVGMEE
jgi:N utilization substance protein B